MDQIKTGKLIRSLRQRQHLTQLQLAEKLGVSDKAVSKWERGCGAPDLSLLPALADALQADMKALLTGTLGENDAGNGDMEKMRFHVCPNCGNLIFASDDACVSCCGKTVPALQPKKADAEERLTAELSDDEWFVTSGHEMRRGHYISFVAFLNGDTLFVKKLYPEWGLEARLPFRSHGKLVWYCTRHGLFFQDV